MRPRSPIFLKHYVQYEFLFLVVLNFDTDYYVTVILYLR